MQRPEQQGEKCRDKRVGRHKGNDDREQCLHQTPPEFFKMAQEWHRTVIKGHLTKTLLSVAPFLFARP